eukprot:11098001-Lingulodinium_polyedra.AAC.1
MSKLRPPRYSWPFRHPLLTNNWVVSPWPPHISARSTQSSLQGSAARVSMSCSTLGTWRKRGR